MILAVGARPVSVTYELILAGTSERLSGHGIVQTRHQGLEEMWLQPIVMLRLEDGRHIDIAITELEEHQGKFEVIVDYD